MRKLLIHTGMAALIVLAACSPEFLDKKPQGVLSEDVLATEKGVEALLIAAYAQLDGWAGWNNGDPWSSAGSNWVYGDVTSDDSHKGSDAGDQPQIVEIERYQSDPGNPYFARKWGAVYDAISRCNDALRVLKLAEEKGTITPSRVEQIRAEARVLRGHYHFEAQKMWNSVPYLDENVTDPRVPNAGPIWAQIEADLQFGVENLPETRTQVGRVDKWVALSFLAKAKMFQRDYNAALGLLNQVINSGRFSLTPCFFDNFNAETQLSNPELIFSVQHSVNDGTNEGEAGGWGDVLNYPYTGGPGTCCGFNQPSQNLVNAYQTENGLPLLDNFNATNVASDQGIESSQPFTEHTGPLDPRLDWTVGRRGVPYLDWGDHAGKNWIRDQAYSGPYAPKKNVFFKSQDKVLSTAAGWAQGPNANNYNLIRYADVLLWAAECEVEVGSLEKAREYVNQIRNRAKNGCWVLEGGVKDNGSHVGPGGEQPAANYVIEPYSAPWTDKVVARKAVQFERRLELAMEGHRFFDLVRYGTAEQVLNAYLQVEQTRRSFLNGAVFTATDAYYPLPQVEIDNSFKDGAPTLTQNPGY